jgi:hypothetical protein
MTTFLTKPEFGTSSGWYSRTLRPGVLLPLDFADVAMITSGCVADRASCFAAGGLPPAEVRAQRPAG